jgi:iron complex outermembrane recepter protein
MLGISRIAMVGAAALALWPVAVAAQTPPAAPTTEVPPTVVMPPIEVVGTSPLPGVGIDRDKVPSNTRSVPPPDITTQGPGGIGTALDQHLGSINVNGNQDNPYQPDIQFRGFEASPVLGTPIGMAVYQNGVRLNEPFGDNVNWDMVPDFAIDRMNVIPTNPIYGLNALGGAVVIDMKNGFTYHDGEGVASGGSFGRRQFTLQYGKQIDNVAAYIAGNAYNDQGFREFSPTQIRQLYADIGAESDQGSLHVSFTGANNDIIGVGPTPIQLVDVNRSAVFTTPQEFRNSLELVSLNGQYFADDTLSFQNNFYVRHAARRVFNGNTTDVQACDPSIPNTLCLGDPFTVLFDTSGQPVSNVLNGATPGENDNSTVTSLGIGGALQGTYTAPLFDHGNHLVAGVSIDHAEVDFHSTNELGTIDPSTLLVSGVGVIIAQPDGSLAPVKLATTTNYYGLYASDTFDVTPELAVTVGGRYNVAQVDLTDEIGTALNGNNRFTRLNPAAGATYRITPNLTAYFGYAQANRAPTAGEIACSNPSRPCSLDNFLTSDPSGLKQVIAHTYEAGVRGKLAVQAFDTPGRVDWNLGLFRTNLDDDILNVPSAIISSGFFQNIGSTRRQGIEASVAYTDKSLQVSVDYSLVDATFQSPITLSSPNNPAADANGNIQVKPGDVLPGVPLQRLKVNADYWITDEWKIGGNLSFASGQYYFGDQSNQNPKLPGYYVVNVHTSYQITKNVEAFILAENLFDHNYATFGIFGDVTKTPLPGVANPSDPRFISVAPPLAAFGGVRIRF